MFLFPYNDLSTKSMFLLTCVEIFSIDENMSLGVFLSNIRLIVSYVINKNY